MPSLPTVGLGVQSSPIKHLFCTIYIWPDLLDAIVECRGLKVTHISSLKHIRNDMDNNGLDIKRENVRDTVEIREESTVGVSACGESRPSDAIRLSPWFVLLWACVGIVAMVPRVSIGVTKNKQCLF